MNSHDFKYPLLQAAGVKGFEDAKTLIEAGFEYIGFPQFLDVHQEDISIERAKAIVEQFPQSVESVLITYLNRASDIIDAMKNMGSNIVQLHGRISIDELKKLRFMNPEISIIKSLVINDENLGDLLKLVRSTEELVNAFITDTYDSETGASGATGKTHNWSISKNIVASTIRPVILAGGLTPINVAQAIEYVKPFGIDVHSGIEKSDGSKDISLSSEFVRSAKESFGNII